MERCCGCRAATSSSQMIVSTASIWQKNSGGFVSPERQ
jgi:hypothetical protein